MNPADSPYAGAVAAFFVGLAGFQAALAGGAPWGRAAWGGGNPGVLPTRLRVASGVAAPVALSVAAVAAGRLGGPVLRRRVLGGSTAYLVLGAILNGASRSPLERAIWTPACAAGAAASWLAWRAEPAG